MNEDGLKKDEFETVPCDGECEVGTFHTHHLKDKPSSELQHWGDAQQYRSEAMPFNVNDGPRVTLLNATPDPLGSIAAMCGVYEGKIVRSLVELTDDQRRHYWKQLQKTHLKAPLESVQLHFLIEGVTRSFTHQMVRQRTACYAQESLRFAVKEGIDEEVRTPPFLRALPAEDPRVRQWHKVVNAIDDAYSFLVDNGVPAEEARDVLPHGITTRLHYITNLRGLLEHAGNRLCTQAQFEWRLVISKMAKALRDACWLPDGPMTKIMGREAAQVQSWQFREIADALQPICYMTGKCEFKAKFDRSCSIRDRVDAFEKAGIPSNGWHSSGWVDAERNPLNPIQSWEWLTDPGAARS